MIVRVALLVIACLAIADARPPKEPPPKPPSGYLTIDSQPSAVIYVDGKRIGETPIIKLALPAGRHVVRAVRDNGDAQRLNVDIDIGKTLDYRLRWDGREPTDPNGYLTLFSSPPARVFIDGVDTGKTTPIKELQLAPGRHKVTFLVDGNKYTYAAKIEAGQSTVMTKQFN